MKSCILSISREETELCRFNARKTESALERMRGLLFAPPLGENDALIISPCNSVHCFFMSYTIDVVYLDRNDRICKLVADLRPWRASAHFRAARVIELASGQINQHGLIIGDRCQCLDS